MPEEEDDSRQSSRASDGGRLSGSSVDYDWHHHDTPGRQRAQDLQGAEQAVPQANGGALCMFEFFYLARPDTRLAGVEVHGARVRMGERLAEEAPVEADLVLPIPDSGTPAAIGFARATGNPIDR